jgi:hypothetical protein
MTVGAVTSDRITDGRRLPWWVVPAATVPVLAAVAALRLRATVDCDLGVNAGAASIGFLLVLPVVFGGTVAVAEGPRRVLPGSVAAALAVLLLVMASSLLLTQSGPPEGYPNSVATCSDNVPSWWPSWLPT